MARQILLKVNTAIFFAFVAINLAGVFLPELSFDALWYHLTLSKLFLAKGQWYFPGGLFYYSAMPRLAELISLPIFSIAGYVGPKLTQFISGLLVCFFLFRLIQKFTSDKLLSWTGLSLFYATWLVSWQSSSGYVDLVRAAFETLALYFIVTRISTQSKIIAGVMLGLAVGTKWHALGSLLLYALIFSPIVIIPALLTASPWFLIAILFTGNPVYPLFEDFMTKTQLVQVPSGYYSPFSVLFRFITAPIFLTHPSEDFLSPVIGLVYLISLFGLISSSRKNRQVALLAVLGTFLLLITPPPSTRYYLPFLPAVILSAIYIISKLKEKICLIFIGLFTLSAVLILSLRLISFSKFFPLIAGELSPNEFLASLSYRLPDTFIDADDYVVKNLPSAGSYLIGNRLHNLYYFPFDFDHESFAAGMQYDYLVTKGEDPKNIKGELLHTNPIGIQIFKL